MPTDRDSLLGAPLTQEEDVSVFSEALAADDDYRLGGRPPFVTLMSLAGGPFVSEIIGSVLAVISTYWISKAVGEVGNSAVGFVAVPEAITVVCTQFILATVTLRVSYMIGRKDISEGPQFLADMLRLSMLLGVVAGAIIYFITPLTCRWLNADDASIKLAMQYITPICIGEPILLLFAVVCGVIQAEGRSFTYAVSQITAMTLKTLIYEPILFFVFKASLWGSSIARLGAIVTITLYYLVAMFNGSYTMRPSLKMLFKGFSPATWPALKIGFPSFVMHLALALPKVIMQKFIMTAAKHANLVAETSTAFNISSNLYAIVSYFWNSVTHGLNPALGYCRGAERYHRFFKLCVYAVLIGAVWSAFWTVIFQLFTSFIVSLFTSKATTADLCEAMLRRLYLAPVLDIVQFTTISAYQALKYVTSSTIFTFVTIFISFPLFSWLFYSLDNDSPTNVIWTYTANDVFGFLASAIVWATQLRFLFHTERSQSAIL